MLRWETEAEARRSGVNTDALSASRPAMLVEGELDALTMRQEAGDLMAAVATGATGGARRMHWIARLALCSAVLVAYDADTPGDTAAAFWLERLENARRWRPYWGDANAMAQAGADVRAWVAAGVGQSALEDKRRDPDLTGFTDHFSAQVCP